MSSTNVTPSEIIEQISSGLECDEEQGQSWKGRAIAFSYALTRPLCFLRDRGYIDLDPETFIKYSELSAVERLVCDHVISINGRNTRISDPAFDDLLEPLKDYVSSLPGYMRGAKGSQSQKTQEQHDSLTVQPSRVSKSVRFS